MCAVPRYQRFPSSRSQPLRRWPNRRMAADEVVHLLLQRDLLPQCRMPRRQCRTFQLRPGWPHRLRTRRPRTWRPHIWPRRRTWRLLTSPRLARLPRWPPARPLMWRRRMRRRHHGIWRCRMEVDHASLKAVLRPTVPLRRLRTNEAGPSTDGLQPARKDVVRTQMQPRANSTAMRANATSIVGTPPDRRTRRNLVNARWRARGQRLAATPPSGEGRLAKPATKRSAALLRAALKDAPSKAVWSNAARRSSEITFSPISASRTGAAVQRHRN